MTLSKLLVDVPNPFGDGIVSNPWDFDASRTPDVESIHAVAFATCVRLLLQDVRRYGQSSLLIDGPAGSGKTHLVARLLRRLHVSDPPGLLCYVNLDDMAPQILWWNLRRRIASDLLSRPDFQGKTGIERLLEYRLPGLLQTAAPREPVSLPDWIRRVFSSSGRKQICVRLRQELFEKVRLDREVRCALLHLFNDDGEQAGLARDWLVGDRMNEEQLHRLGLPHGDLSDQVLEHQSREVVLSLLRLAGESLPIVLCFDQIEHLMHTLQDRGGFVRLVQMIAKLRHEGGKGLFIVSFVRSDLVQHLRDAAGGAGWARIAENQTSLSPLTWEHANQLILHRMNAVKPLQELRRGQGDEYWPLSKQCLQEIHHRMRLHCTPRELLWECKIAFGDPSPPPPPEDYLFVKWQQKYQQKKKAPGGDRLLHALNGVPWLAQLLGSAYEKIDLVDLQEGLPDANLFLQTSGGGRIAFSACPRTPQLWRRFDRLLRDWKLLSKRLDCRRLVLVCDTPAKELPAGTQSRLQTLSKVAGVLSVCPPAEQIIGLDALHSLLTEANTGDLVYEGKAVPEEDVERWARSRIVAPGHELGVMRLLFDELGLDLQAVPAARKAQATLV
jgi:hypothetical protein